MKVNRHAGSERGGIFAKLTALIVILLLCLALYLVRIPLLRVMGNYWNVGVAPSNADAIIILSDDDFTADRAARAAELYHSGWAPRVVASGRWLRPYASIAELMQHDLQIRGVPKKAIVPFAHDAPDTLEELRDINDFVEKHHWKQIMIVTSSYHTRRTRYLARHIFPRTIEVQVVSAPDVNYDPDSWWRTRGGLKIFLHEAVGMIVAMWEVHHVKPRVQETASPGKETAGFLPGNRISRESFTPLCLCTIVL
ncbi:MAG TPA: YdcF family protein [Candidatus Acidoferrales bacterium]|nr:YdcF family protein [Candidatus Acidoferrales bacterium]